MTTASTLINAACRQIGFTPDASEAADALEAFNSMLNLWAISGGIFQRARENWSLTSADPSYTIGSGQDFDTTLPLRVIKAFTRTSNVDYPIDVVSLDDYGNIWQKTAPGRPYCLYLDRGYATGTILMYPTPDSTYDFHLWSEKPLAVYSSLSDTVTIPPHYEPAVRFNLPVYLAAEFGISVKPETAIIADQALAAVKNYNLRPVPMADTDILGHSGGFDIDTGFSR